jgi:hypothetical protein
MTTNDEALMSGALCGRAVPMVHTPWGSFARWWMRASYFEPVSGEEYETMELRRELAANPTIVSVALGALVALEWKDEDGEVVEHTFAPPHPTLAYHKGGLLIVGGRYRVTKTGRIRNVQAGGEGATASPPPLPRAMDGQIDAAVRQYAIDHWGQKGKRRVTQLPAADPSQLSFRLGELLSVTYRTKKGDDEVMTDYRHAFERRRPVLSHHEGGLIISGGTYRVEPRGIVG